MNIDWEDILKEFIDKWQIEADVVDKAIDQALIENKFVMDYPDSIQ